MKDKKSSIKKEALKMLDKSKMTKLDELVNNGIVTYKNLDDYVKSNNLDKNDFWNGLKAVILKTALWKLLIVTI